MERMGWSVLRIRGSHHQLVHPRFPGVLTIAIHDTLSRPAMKKVLKAGGIEEEDFIRVGGLGLMR